MDIEAKRKARRDRRAKRKAAQATDAAKLAKREVRRTRRVERRKRQALARQRAVLSPETPEEVDLALKTLGLDPAKVGTLIATASRTALYIDLSRSEAKIRAQELAELIDQICIIYCANPGAEPAVYRIMPGEDASPGQCTQAVELIEPGFAGPVAKKIPSPLVTTEEVLLLCEEQGVDPRLCELARQYLQGEKREEDGRTDETL